MRLPKEATNLEVLSTQNQRAPQHVQYCLRLGRGFISRLSREPEYTRLREEVIDLEVSSTQSRQAPQHVQHYSRLGQGFISQLSREHEYMRLPEEVTNLLGKSTLLDQTARGTQPPTKRNGGHLPMRQRKPNLFWVSAISPMAVVAVGCLYAYLGHGEQHGIAIVGDLKKGLNPSSIHYLNFDSRYLPATIRAGVVTGIISMVEGIAIGRSFAIIKNEQTDGNKEMIAYGFMNIIGSLTSCYLTTGPFSKTAVNVNSGCKTPMANVVQGFCMMLTLLFLAPIFSYTPLVALAAIIMSAMLGLINYEEMYHLYKVDKFDFAICMAAFFGVSFGSMDIGLLLSVGLSLLRALLYVARPAACKLGRLPNTSLYRDTEQYPETMSLEGILVLQLGSPVYFANCSYIRERILRYINEEDAVTEYRTEHILLDLSGVASIDMSGIDTFIELIRVLKGKHIKLGIVNPRIEVLEKMTLAKFVDVLGKQAFYLSIEEAIQSCRFTMDTSTKEEALGSSKTEDVV
ncbi:hypothetical protein Gogos_015944 [Gossypium gossypioides]|uniref:STAS domain-containing protein n=1 Tax=Gossypium gossypioides TaxID=34282 RepID=A0A7J9B642_GOSGO|nr:hypothetical protein [Gossypium gossypioides]